MESICKEAKRFPTESSGEVTPEVESENSEEITPQVEKQQDEDVSDTELEEYLGKAEFSNLQEVETQLNDQLKNEGMTDVVTTSIDSRGLVISLNNA